MHNSVFLIIDCWQCCLSLAILQRQCRFRFERSIYAYLIRLLGEFSYEEQRKPDETALGKHFDFFFTFLYNIWLFFMY